MIDTWVRNEIKQMKPVAWGDIPEDSLGRLLWGENPLLPLPAIRAIKKEVRRINQYPSPTQGELKKLLATYNGVKPENIIITNGSDDALELIAKVFVAPNDEVLIPIPTFPCYETVSQMMGAVIRTIPLNRDFSLPLPQLRESLTPKTKIVWFANPNNPTGNILIQPQEITLLAPKIKGVLIVDECYFEISGVTAVPFIRNDSNIIVVRSFSKVFGLAGIRLGYIIADPQVISYLTLLAANNQVFAVNRFALAAGTALLRDTSYVQKQIKQFTALKNEFERKLKQIDCLKVVPTQTTFCLIQITKPRRSAKQLKRKLEQQYGIFVKDCSIYQNLSPSYVYLGVPKRNYQRAVVKALQTLLAEERRI